MYGLRPGNEVDYAEEQEHECHADSERFMEPKSGGEGGMSCENVCLGGYESDGSFEFESLYTPRARKDFRCEECRRLIPKGTQYQKYSGKFEGDLFSTKTCLQCVEISAAYRCDHGAMVIGELWTDIRDQMFPNGFTTGCLEKLTTAAAKALILERWREWKGLAA